MPLDDKLVHQAGRVKGHIVKWPYIALMIIGCIGGAVMFFLGMDDLVFTPEQENTTNGIILTTIGSYVSWSFVCLLCIQERRYYIERTFDPASCVYVQERRRTFGMHLDNLTCSINGIMGRWWDLTRRVTWLGAACDRSCSPLAYSIQHPNDVKVWHRIVLKQNHSKNLWVNARLMPSRHRYWFSQWSSNLPCHPLRTSRSSSTVPHSPHLSPNCEDNTRNVSRLPVAINLNKKTTTAPITCVRWNYFVIFIHMSTRAIDKMPCTLKRDPE